MPFSKVKRTLYIRSCKLQTLSISRQDKQIVVECLVLRRHIRDAYHQHSVNPLGNF